MERASQWKLVKNTCVGLNSDDLVARAGPGQRHMPLELEPDQSVCVSCGSVPLEERSLPRAGAVRVGEFRLACRTIRGVDSEFHASATARAATGGQ
jgi:hypothetical protein